jgi:hypothetical protein
MKCNHCLRSWDVEVQSLPKKADQSWSAITACDHFVNKQSHKRENQPSISVETLIHGSKSKAGMPKKTCYRWPSWPVMKCHHCLRSHSQQTITRTSKPTIHICWSVEIVRHSIFLSANRMVGTTPCPCRPVLSVI